MAESTWGNWFQGLKLATSQPVKRRTLARTWGTQAEHLEERALLSAAPVSAEVSGHHAKAAAFEYPTVNGTWNLEGNPERHGTAVLTQNGKSVTAVFNIDGVPTINFKDKFTKSAPRTISGQIKYKFGELGKVTISVTLTFPGEAGSPTTLSGTANAPGGPVQFTGEKQIVAVSSLGTSRKAPDMFPHIEGDWDFTLDHDDLGQLTGDLNITQSGKGDRDVTGVVDLDEGGTITFAGKFDKKELFDVSGKVTIAIPETFIPGKVSFLITFNIEYDLFEGTADSKKFGSAEIHAELAEM